MLTNTLTGEIAWIAPNIGNTWVMLMQYNSTVQIVYLPPKIRAYAHTKGKE